MPSSDSSWCKRGEESRPCSNASLEAHPGGGRTRVVVGLGDIVATVDIDPFAWKKSEDPEGVGRDVIPLDA